MRNNNYMCLELYETTRAVQTGPFFFFTGKKTK